ncbi:FAD-dependent oxidoreductase [Mycobacterium conspicuum]|uniref:Hydroxylase n=1 Tax=Mycobacterium conspicuum TaxID=44010 RepID=A0A7I7Y9U8_9MYCO|nr:FAD-dependent monooxygenase [Mycobacterium conspicuum]BBZ37842.1 hydroxylase [Mycobacterium conspicuum]
MIPALGRRAVVIGASISGLLAARVLADHYEHVTVVDRDVLPAGPLSRRGVPQAAHGHLLLARCPPILNELFPGILHELVADGAPVWADGDLSKIDLSFGGHRLVRTGSLRCPEAYAQYYPSRPLLEYRLRQRIRAIPNVTLVDRCGAADLTATADRTRISGVRVAGRDQGETALTAQLVVDATGRGSRTPVFLEKLGYGRPPENELMVRVAYASQMLKIPTGTLHTRLVGRLPEAGLPAGFVLVGNENDDWVLTLTALAGSQPPTEYAEMLEFVEQLAPVDILAAVRTAQPVGPVTRYRVPSNRWRRYDKMRRLPDGLIVVGDAICGFNPVYGQGMTMAALDAVVLGNCLRHEDRHLPRRFYHDSAKNIAVAWRTAVGADLALPQVAGPRPISMRITNAFLERVMIAA